MSNVNELDPGVMPESLDVAIYTQTPRMAPSFDRAGDWIEIHFQKPEAPKKCECGLHTYDPKLMVGHSNYCPLGDLR